MRAWHFVGSTLRNGDPVPKDGEKLIFPDEPILCEQGLHASLLPFDALRYAPGDILCLVEMGGRIIHGGDKLVATERTIICRMDATKMLRYYARMQALSVAHLWDIPDVVLEYLMTGNGKLRGKAWAATKDASRDIVGNAAWTAAWTAAGAASHLLPFTLSRKDQGARKDFNALVYEAFSDWMEDAA